MCLTYCLTIASELAVESFSPKSYRTFKQRSKCSIDFYPYIQNQCQWALLTLHSTPRTFQPNKRWPVSSPFHSTSDFNSLSQPVFSHTLHLLKQVEVSTIIRLILFFSHTANLCLTSILFFTTFILLTQHITFRHYI